MSVFEITGKHLEELKRKKVVDLVREIIWAEATISGIKKSSINISMNTDFTDGVDGEVTGAEIESKNGIIKAGNTSYQVKSGRFSLTDPEIDEILFRDSDHGELKPRIKSCFDNNGTFVVIFTGWDSLDKAGPVEKRFLGRLGEIRPEYKKPKIEVWGQSKIIGFLDCFPSLQLEILQIRDEWLYCHSEWSRLDDMQLNIHLGKEQRAWLEDFQNRLRRNDAPVHVRITGDRGMGKTRLAFEATKSHDLAPLTIYVDDPFRLDYREFLTHICEHDNTYVILVVDECDSYRQSQLWNILEKNSPRIKLVTIFVEQDAPNGTTQYLELPILNDEQIDKILEEYGIPQSHRQKWVEYSESSPRAAHRIGQDLEKHPEDISKPPDDVPIWDRYMAS